MRPTAAFFYPWESDASWPNPYKYSPLLEPLGAPRLSYAWCLVLLITFGRRLIWREWASKQASVCRCCPQVSNCATGQKEDRYLFGLHASGSLDERGIVEWQMVIGILGGHLFRERLDADANKIRTV